MFKLKYDYKVGDEVYDLDPFYGDDKIHIITNVFYSKEYYEIMYQLDDLENPYVDAEYLRPKRHRLNENFCSDDDLDILRSIGYPIEKAYDIWKVSYYEIFDWIFDKYHIACSVNLSEKMSNLTKQSIWEGLIIPFHNETCTGIRGFNQENKADAYVETLKLVSEYINSTKSIN